MSDYRARRDASDRDDVAVVRELLADVEHDLLTRLEFQDVLKNKLRRAYLETVQIPLTSSKLYGLLDSTLHEIRKSTSDRLKVDRHVVDEVSRRHIASLKPVAGT